MSLLGVLTRQNNRIRINQKTTDCLVDEQASRGGQTHEARCNASSTSPCTLVNELAFIAIFLRVNSNRRRGLLRAARLECKLAYELEWTKIDAAAEIEELAISYGNTQKYPIRATASKTYRISVIRDVATWESFIPAYNPHLHPGKSQL